MRIRTVCKLASILVGLIAFPNQSSAATLYELRLFNVDDFMTASISNSDFEGALISSATYPGDSPYTDITSFVRPGANQITFNLTNLVGGWTYGYDLRANGVTIASDQCGTVGLVGCAGNDQTLGTVFSRTIALSVTEPSVAVPEPSTWAMILMGFFGIGVIMRRVREKERLTFAYT